MSQRLINLLLSASLFSMALADDTFKITGNAAAGTGGGVAGLIVLVLDVLVFGLLPSRSCNTGPELLTLIYYSGGFPVKQTSC